MANIIIPSLVVPKIDRTEFKDGRVTIYLWLEEAPLYVSGILPINLPDQDYGWIAFERPAKIEKPKRPEGIFSLYARAQLITPKP
jgi:hypothetical protein